MITSLPGDIFTSVFTGLDTGLSAGAQIVRASNGTVVSARSVTGVVERPTGSGTYVVTQTAPIDADTYLVVLDWDGGNVTPLTSRTDELRVSSSIPVDPSGLGLIADSAKAHMGHTFDGLAADAHYGGTFILGRINTVKRRVMNNPPAMGDEDTLDPLVIDYLGKLVVLELMPAAYDYWATQYQSESTGNDPTEVASYPDRIKSMEKIQETLLVQVRRDEAVVLPLIDSQRLRAESDGPAIDELEDCRVTQDPRNYPPFRTQQPHDRWSTGVRIG